MQKKRIIALLMSVTLAMSCFLTGCGETEVNTSESKESVVDNKESTGTVVSEEEELEPVTLKYWMAADKTEDADKVEAEINEYLADVLPNTTVEITWVSFSEWAEKWSKAMSAQEQIDLAWMGWLNSVETEVSMGSLMPIDDLLAEYGKGIVDTLSEPVVEKHRSLDGNLYFLPSWQGMIGGRMGLYLPHEIVELAGEGWAENFQKSLYETWKLPYSEIEKKKAEHNKAKNISAQMAEREKFFKML